MIAEIQPRARRLPRRCYWHDFFVIWPRTILIETGITQPTRARIFWQPMMRRWSGTRHCWLWALPGTFEKGSRP